MNPGIHSSVFCLTGITKVKEYQCIKQAGTLVANSNSQKAIWRQEFGTDLIHKPEGGRDEKVCGYMD